MKLTSFFEVNNKEDIVVYINRKPLEEFKGNEADICQLFIRSETLVNLDTSSLSVLPNVEELTFIGVDCTDYSFLKQSFKMQCLSIESCNLKTIPTYLNAFSALELLDLSNNKIRQIAHIDWGRFAQLKQLNLGGNEINSLSDTTIWAAAMEHLNLYKNPIEDLDIQLGHSISKLKELGLAATSIAAIPPEISVLKNLEKLDLGYTPMTTLPDALKSLDKLTALDLSGIKWKEIPKVLFELVALEKLRMDWTNLLGVKLAETVGKAYNLKTVSIAFGHLQTIPEWVQFFPHILELHAENNPIETLPEWLADFPYLQLIYLSDDALIEEEQLPPIFDKRQWSILT